jgi:hypothetical protein
MQDDDTPGIAQILPSGKNGMGIGGSTANIPREKLLYVANDQEGENYFGVSLLGYAYKPWKIKDGLQIMNAVALENTAMGVPHIKKGLSKTGVLDYFRRGRYRNSRCGQYIDDRGSIAT